MSLVIREILPLESQGRTWDYEPQLSWNRLSVECPVHGAMNCVSSNMKLWRCLACELGCEVIRD